MSDVILGQTFLKRYDAHIKAAEGTLRLRKRNRTITLKPKARMNEVQLAINYVLTALKAASPNLISEKQARRALKKREAFAFVAIVKQAAPCLEKMTAYDSDDEIADAEKLTAEKTDTTDKPKKPSPPAEVEPLLNAYSDLFQTIPELPPDRGLHHTIPLLPGAQIVYKRGYRLSPAEHAEAAKQIEKLLSQGFIRPSTSPWGFPILFVTKPRSTELRMCVDYRELNKQTVKNRYPIPRIDDILDSLAGSTIFTSLDLQAGYHQIRLNPEDVPKTAFNAPQGHFEYTVMCFGLTNAPSTFQTVMNRLLAPFVGKFVAVYLDDILIYSKSAEEHLEHLKLVFDVLRKEKFYVRVDKCAWMKPELFYLGHIISADGVRMDPAKVEAIKNWPQPPDQHELRKFLGLTNWFHKHIHHYAVITEPLNALLKKGVNVATAWGSAATEAFTRVKQLVSEEVILRFPDFTKEFEVITDASLLGTGAVLLQEGRPVAFSSKKFTAAEKNYATGDQELCGVYHSLKQWRCYLEGPTFKLVTDHHPLIYLHSQPDLSRRQARWMEFFTRFHFDWVFRSGKLNMADPLSRHPFLATLSAITRQCASYPLKQRIADACRADPWFNKPENTEHLTRTTEGLWMRYTDKDTHVVVVPNDADLIHSIISDHHDAMLAGHPGKTRTLELISRHYWWSNMNRNVNDYVAACDKCQRSKVASGKPTGLLQPLPVPANPWDSVSMDFIVGLPPTSAGFNAILVVVDRLTKMAHLMPCKDTTTAEQFAELFFNNIVRLHGIPKSTISDRGSLFTSNFWKALCKLLGVDSVLSSAYHPETDGQTERTNRVIGDMLRTYADHAPKQWDKYLTAAEFAINNAVNRSTDQSPFYLNYGRHPSTPVMRQMDATVPAAVDTSTTLTQRITDAKACLEAAQQRSEAYANTGRRDVTFSPGEHVLLSTKNLNKYVKGPKKLLPKWIGPFVVDKMIGNAAVRLQLPAAYKMHNVFHVSLVKPYKFTGTVQPPPPPVYWDDEGVSYEVERILDHKDVKIGSKLTRQYLVKWKDFPPEHNSWEPDSNFHSSDHIDAYCNSHNVPIVPQKGGR